MEQIKPSITAWAVALRRAVHQLLDCPLILKDPFAIPIVGMAHAQAALAKYNEAGIVQRKFSRALRAMVVARSRFAEDHLAHAVASHGITQYVLLGAGLDTFAHRNPHANLRVFEVDHPATQSWKRELLAQAQLPMPPALTLVPTNFETQTLADTLPAAGFNPNLPACFAWLGVVPYLTLPAFRQTLSFLAALPPATQVALDYAIQPDSLGITERLVFNRLAQRVAAAGEPFQLFFDPPQLHAEFANAGFTKIEDLSAAEINVRYFQNREDHFQVVGRIGRLLHATM